MDTQHATRRRSGVQYNWIWAKQSLPNAGCLAGIHFLPLALPHTILQLLPSILSPLWRQVHAPTKLHADSCQRGWGARWSTNPSLFPWAHSHPTPATKQGGILQSWSEEAERARRSGTGCPLIFCSVHSITATFHLIIGALVRNGGASFVCLITVRVGRSALTQPPSIIDHVWIYYWASIIHSRFPCENQRTHTLM